VTTSPDFEFVLPADYKPLYSGKVRDLYETLNGDLLFVATDRISAYDVVLPTRIPDKGKILTAMSMWWFERLAEVVPNHVISLDVPPVVAGRAMLCQRLDMLPIEAVIRGYLTGSGLKDYQRTGSVCGIELPPGLVDGSRLPDAIFTPATKAAIGDHDENIDFDQVVATIGEQSARTLRQLTASVYVTAEGIARGRGLVLADTKLEFGRDPQDPERLILADEVLTPDSSRFWPAEDWEPGRPQKSFDKQYVRDWLTSPAAGWEVGTSPAPELPDEVVEKTRSKYVEAYERLTGQSF
jgi:phosphoribosylaminoimidazole-succinocarboxamide synthase